MHCNHRIAGVGHPAKLLRSGSIFFLAVRPFRAWRKLAVPLSFFLFAPLLWGQMEAGRISGAVTDSSGARVRKAQVSLDNPLSGRKSQTQSDDQGQFEFDNVPYGSYAMRVSALGFNSSTVQVSVRSNVPFEYRYNWRLPAPSRTSPWQLREFFTMKPPGQKSSSTKSNQAGTDRGTPRSTAGAGFNHAGLEYRK